MRTFFIFCIVVLTVGSFGFEKLKAQNESNDYVSGIIILKFKDDSKLGEVAEQLFKDNQDFKSVTNNGLFDELNQKYLLKSISKLHPNALSLEEMKKKFPERSKRMPKNAKLPNLAFTYKLEFAQKNLNIEKACQEYMMSSHVEYAQPDRIHTINKTPIE